MKDSGVRWLGMIPKAWDLDKIVSLYSERSTKVSDRDYPALSVTKQGIVPQLESAAKTDNGDNRKLIKKNDFVINSRSDRRGSCGISEYEGSCSLINTVLAPKNNMVNQYYNYLFKTELFADEFYKWGHGIVDDLWSTKWSSMKNIMVPFPPLTEQRVIADYLDIKCTQIDTIIAKEQSVIEKLQEYKESIINEAVTKGVDIQVEFKPSGYDFIGDIPKSWKLLKVRYLGLLQNGISKSSNYFGHGMPFISYKDVYSSFVIPNQLDGLIESTKEEQEKYSVQSGDIFFTRTSETIDEIGISSVCKKTILYATFSGFLIRLRLINNIVSPDWAKYYFRSNHLRAYFVKEMNLVTRASLSQELLKSLPVLIPSQEEQNKIIKYLDEKCNTIDSIILKKQALINKLTEYKKSLIYEVVTGKKEVPHV